jgi:hypothetical protein
MVSLFRLFNMSRLTDVISDIPQAPSSSSAGYPRPGRLYITKTIWETPSNGRQAGETRKGEGVRLGYIFYTRMTVNGDERKIMIQHRGEETGSGANIYTQAGGVCGKTV